MDEFVQIINREKECGKLGKRSGIFGNVHTVSKSYSQDIPILWITLCQPCFLWMEEEKRKAKKFRNYLTLQGLENIMDNDVLRHIEKFLPIYQ